MPLVPPNLDDRTFDDLFQEARLRAARYNPLWTDYNESDPGITLVQLFAWLTEMMLYRMNQVPERSYLKFLQLLGLELRPAQAATAYLSFTATKEAEIATIARGSRIGAQPPGGGDAVIFETEEDLDVIALPLSDVQVFDGSTFTSVLRSNEATGLPYMPFGFQPHLGNALYLGFDPPEGFDPASPPPDKRAFPELMRFRVFLTTDVQATRAEVCRGGDPPPPAPSVALAWEYRPKPGADWRALPVVRDDSVAFTREGDILVRGPAAAAKTVEGKPEFEGTGADAKPKEHVWLRVRIARGNYPAGKEPEIDFLRPNTVPATNLATVRLEPLGVGDGRPGQSLTLANAPVAPGTLQLSVESGGASEVWTRVDDFLASGPDDNHYTLNAATGEVRFGDGKRGEVPPPGAAITADVYRFGGGDAGNVAAGLINQPLTDLGNLTVKNERAAVGGRDEQTVDDLKDQAPAQLRCRGRAVTAEDFQALAAQAGGVARAIALPLAHPDFPYPRVKIPGAVTVVIVPDTDERNPTPSQDEIRSVCKYLDGFRLITTEVYVKKPSYRKVQVRATVQANPTISFGDVSRAVQDAINTHLDPLGRTWEGETPRKPRPTDPPLPTTPRGFGQSFFPTRLFGVIQGVKGVVDVTHLDVLVDGVPAPNDCPVEVPADGLVYGADHQITVRASTERPAARKKGCP